MKPFFQALLHSVEKYDPRVSIGVAVGAALLILLVWWMVRRRRPSADELERRRREKLATTGRITDGHLVDIRAPEVEPGVMPTPDVLFYSYRLAGVTYNCAQDVSKLPEQVSAYQLDQPLQVRYDPRNPGNSIVVSESWSGLWERRSYPRTGTSDSNRN